MCSRSTEASRADNVDATVPAPPSIAVRSAFTSAQTRRDASSLPSEIVFLSSVATRLWIASGSGGSVESIDAVVIWSPLVQSDFGSADNVRYSVADAVPGSASRYVDVRRTFSARGPLGP